MSQSPTVEYYPGLEIYYPFSNPIFRWFVFSLPSSRKMESTNSMERHLQGAFMDIRAKLLQRHSILLLVIVWAVLDPSHDSLEAWILVFPGLGFLVLRVEYVPGIPQSNFVQRL
jgi:hypothetical protein